MIRSLFLLTLLSHSVLLCAEQSASSQQEAQPAQVQKPAPTPQSTATAPKKPRKVWTNEELSNLGNSNVSVVGDPSQKKKNYPSPEGSSAATVAAQYREALRKLRADLDLVNKQLTELRTFNGDNASPSGGVKITGSYSMTPIPERIKQLEARQKQIKARLDAVEDDARHRGIPPGDLR